MMARDKAGTMAIPPWTPNPIPKPTDPPRVIDGWRIWLRWAPVTARMMAIMMSPDGERVHLVDVTRDDGFSDGDKWRLLMSMVRAATEAER